jgi:hypothetical protein
MGIMTAQTMGGLKRTAKACDRCGVPADLLVGSQDRMLCEACVASQDEAVARRLRRHVRKFNNAPREQVRSTSPAS